TPGTQYDALRVTGVATLGGTLQAETINGFLPGEGSRYTLIAAEGGVLGTFADVLFGMFAFTPDLQPLRYDLTVPLSLSGGAGPANLLGEAPSPGNPFAGVNLPGTGTAPVLEVPVTGESFFGLEALFASIPPLPGGG